MDTGNEYLRGQVHALMTEYKDLFSRIERFDSSVARLAAAVGLDGWGAQGCGPVPAGDGVAASPVVASAPQRVGPGSVPLVSSPLAVARPASSEQDRRLFLLGRRMDAVARHIAKAEGRDVAVVLEEFGSFQSDEAGMIRGKRSVSEYLRRPRWMGKVVEKLLDYAIERNLVMVLNEAIFFMDRSGRRVAVLDQDGTLRREAV